MATPGSPKPTPQIVLTFLAPADRCNQRCPACIIDLTEEPVTRFGLAPENYADILDELVSARVPVHSVSFQGYEVTLPMSWPYVEAVFKAANRHGIDRGFITNGMLLDRWVERIRVLGPSRITVSIDGADAATNDAIRGLPGALAATLDSVQRFLERAPEYRDRVAIASTLFLALNRDSLRAMPKLIAGLGLTRWVLAAGLSVEGGIKAPVDDLEALTAVFDELIVEGEREGVRVHVNDEFGRFGKLRGKRPSGFRSVGRSWEIVRVEPAGYVRVGKELLETFDATTARAYDPASDSFLEVIGYHERAAQSEGSERAGDGS